MLKKTITVGLIQPKIEKDNEKNLLQVENLIAQAVDFQPRPSILCLPERWFYVDPLSGNPLDSIQEPFGLQYQSVKKWAKKYHINLISGAIWEFHETQPPRKPYISAYYFNEKGEEIFRQDKIHLYGPESQFFERGDSIVVYSSETLGFTFSILICFDLNLSSHLVSQAVKAGAEFIFSPTLIRKEGRENWDIYVKARALENRVPLLSCNSIGQYRDRIFLGESKIIAFQEGLSSPVKLTCNSLGETPGFLIEEINLSFPNKIREERMQEHSLSRPIGVSLIKGP